MQASSLHAERSLSNATSKDEPYIARDQHVLRYVTWSQRFASTVDEHRLWDSQCSCHEAERRGGTSVVCGKLSRRMHEAPGASAVFLAKVESHERLPNLDEVEGDHCAALQVGCHRQDEACLRGCIYLLSNIHQDLLAEENPTV